MTIRVMDLMAVRAGLAYIEDYLGELAIGWLNYIIEIIFHRAPVRGLNQ